jgi:hypothetical protein
LWQGLELQSPDNFYHNFKMLVKWPYIIIQEGNNTV